MEEVSPLWKWCQALVIVAGLIWIGSWAVPAAWLGPSNEKQPHPGPIAPKPTLKPPPDGCWYVPDKWGGVELDCPYDGLTVEQRRAYDEYQNRLHDEYLAERYAAQADADATWEAQLDPAEADRGSPSPISATVGELATLVRVIDGDTIVVAMNGAEYRVRYIGMDTPESGQEGFEQATSVNRELLASGTLRLQKDVSQTDRYDRLLRYVYAGGVFVNAELVRLGYAQAATYPPDVNHSDYFVKLQREAREAGRGLWAE